MIECRAYIPLAYVLPSWEAAAWPRDYVNGPYVSLS